MCGIIAYAKGTKSEHKDVNKVLDSGLKRLTYRGYDSWGTALSNDVTNRATGEYPGDTSLGQTDAQAGIGHVRWATHGKVTTENAHPHESCDRRFSVVHNGVIENWKELIAELPGRHDFKSDTDTEIIPHFLEHYVEQTGDVGKELNYFHQKAEGNYAIVVLDRQDNSLYALKQGSPLVFGYEMTEDEPIQHPKGAYFGSDLYALSDKITRAFFMQDGDIIKTTGSNLALMREGEWLQGFPEKEWHEFEWTEEEPTLDGYEYWMDKEISEIPEAMERLEKSLDPETEDNQFQKKEMLIQRIKDSDKVIFTASGTSYHAALLRVYYLQKNGVEAQALIASEFENYERVTEDTLVIAVSQSGETRDVLDAINVAKDKGAQIASLVNVPYSTIQRKSDISLEIKAQQENCVAATKTFANQVYLLMHLADRKNLSKLPDKIQSALHEIAFFAFEDANEFEQAGHKDIYIIGNASTYPIAREIALKLKEIAYIHAEGMMAGELKHGTLALIEEGTPVITLDDGTGQIQSNIKEVEARGARTKKLNKNHMDSEEDFVFNSVIYGFYLAMYWAHIKQLPVDRPRNLAKSVTVK